MAAAPLAVGLAAEMTTLADGSAMSVGGLRHGPGPTVDYNHPPVTAANQFVEIQTIVTPAGTPVVPAQPQHGFTFYGGTRFAALPVASCQRHIA